MTASGWFLSILGAAFALVILFVLYLLEYLAYYFVPFWVYALVLIFSYAVLFGLSSRKLGLRKFAFPALFTLALIWLFPWSGESSQGFIRVLRRVQPGMNITEVEAILGDYNRYNRLFEIQNTRRLPSGQLVLIEPDFAIYKHSTPDDGAYNAASGVVHFKNGAVTRIEYIGD